MIEKVINSLSAIFQPKMVDPRVKSYQKTIEGRAKYGPGYEWGNEPSLLQQEPDYNYYSNPIPEAYASGKKSYKQVLPEQQGFNYSPLIETSSKKYNVPLPVLLSLLFTESGYNPKAYNNGDRGIAQISRVWNPQITDEQAYDPNFAIPWAAKTLRDNLDYYGGDWNRAIAAYNVGRGGASIKGPENYGGGPKGQTYLNKIIANLAPEYYLALGLKPGSSFSE